ncbi:DUF1294 domain-containing protein [Edwardsiella tarda]
MEADPRAYPAGTRRRGGWPGGLLGQWLFRHKTRKAAFRNAFMLSVVANLLLLLALWYGLYGRWLL